MWREGLKTTDDLVGMQIPFAPRDSMPPVGQRYNESGEMVANFDHLAYTENDLHAMGLVGDAMRKGRKHWVDVNDHNFFNTLGIRWPIPQGEATQWRYVGAALTKYLPDRCMVFNKDNPARPVTSEPLPLDRRILMWGRKDVQIDSYNDPCEFLVTMAVQNFFDELPDHFKSTKLACAQDQSKKDARHLLQGMMGLAVAQTGFAKFYARANKYDLMPRRRKQYDAHQFIMDTVLPSVGVDRDSRVRATTLGLVCTAASRELGGPEILEAAS